MSWFKNWFNELYPLVYPSRTRAEADREIRFIAAQLPEITEFSCLDVGCGDGRHLALLGTISRLAVGVDLSPELLKIANVNLAKSPNVSLIRGDFRALPFKTATFNLLTSLFTGFGYLDTDDEHLQLLCEWRRVLCPGGKFVLDFLDREFVLASLVAESTREIPGFIITEKRSLSADGLRIEKDVAIKSKDDGSEQIYKESVRAYLPEEIFDLLGGARFAVSSTFSDFTGATYKSGRGRLIIFAESV